MAEEQTKDSQKTIVAFVVGLLIGGMLVWAFSGGDKKPVESTDTTPEATEETNTEETAPTEQAATDEAPALSVGEGKIVVDDQPASAAIAIKSATYPVSEGWIGVRSYQNETLGSVLGAVRFSESQGLIPEDIALVAGTRVGGTYAIVIYQEDGDFDLDFARDIQLEPVFDTFTAQ